MRPRAWGVRPSTAPLAVLFTGGCVGLERQSALHPTGIQAERVYDLWVFMVVVAAVVYALVIGALLYAAFRRRRAIDHEDPAITVAAANPARPAPDDVRAEERRKERVMTRAVTWSLAATAAVLLVVLVVDFSTNRALASLPVREPLVIQAIGHQWWWEFIYQDTVPQNRVSTANELHVPVGRPIILRAKSADVIHSFWLPNVAGKKDLIPGREQRYAFRVDRPGVYRGQCAEFCGHQHAKMAFFVVAESPERYDAWLAQQRQPAPEPVDSVRKRGQDIFLSGPCAVCHTIAGTPAGGRSGPELTHIGSRLTIAAGTLPNTRGNLAGWIVDPQSIKPGVRMPPNQLAPEDLRALLAYLESLK